MSLIANDIAKKLSLSKKDVVLDLCCGNGLITEIIANYCKEVHGVDYSEILINQAKSSKK